MHWIAYDLEIKNCVPKKDEARKSNLKYCNGWGDKVGMGISVLTAYDSLDRMFHVYCDDNKDEFRKRITDKTLVVGFNSRTFDDKVVQACWGFTNQSYDICAELKKLFKSSFKLEEYSLANFNISKGMSGALAPELYQTGQTGKLIDYCLRDTWITAKLFQKILRQEPIYAPTGECVLLKFISDPSLDEKQLLELSAL